MDEPLPSNSMSEARPKVIMWTIESVEGAAAANSTTAPLNDGPWTLSYRNSSSRSYVDRVKFILSPKGICWISTITVDIAIPVLSTSEGCHFAPVTTPKPSHPRISTSLNTTDQSEAPQTRKTRKRRECSFLVTTFK